MLSERFLQGVISRFAVLANFGEGYFLLRL